MCVATAIDVIDGEKLRMVHMASRAGADASVRGDRLCSQPLSLGVLPVPHFLAVLVGVANVGRRLLCLPALGVFGLLGGLSVLFSLDVARSLSPGRRALAIPYGADPATAAARDVNSALTASAPGRFGLFVNLTQAVLRCRGGPGCL